jgi:hypothetical protein
MPLQNMLHAARYSLPAAASKASSAISQLRASPSVGSGPMSFIAFNFSRALAQAGNGKTLGAEPPAPNVGDLIAPAVTDEIKKLGPVSRSTRALNAGANDRPRPRDLSPRASRLQGLVGDFLAQDLFKLVDGLLTHDIDPFVRQRRRQLYGGRRNRAKPPQQHHIKSFTAYLVKA